VTLQDDVLSLLDARRGHFRFESGHHGTLWLDLELLCLHPRRLRLLAVELARRLAALPIEAVCGPLVEGAFVAQFVAEALDLPFAYAEPVARPNYDGLYPLAYRIPARQRPVLQGRAVAIVNDVINAGSAVGGAFADLQACGARPLAVGALLVLGGWTADFAAKKALVLESLATLPNELWTPADCPFCAAGVPLDGGANR
jgi:orotate phosphoribosyltransferase